LKTNSKTPPSEEQICGRNSILSRLAKQLCFFLFWIVTRLIPSEQQNRFASIHFFCIEQKHKFSDSLKIFRAEKNYSMAFFLLMGHMFCLGQPILIKIGRLVPFGAWTNRLEGF
jgi:hypothetical protein